MAPLQILKTKAINEFQEFHSAVLYSLVHNCGKESKNCLLIYFSNIKYKMRNHSQCAWTNTGRDNISRSIIIPLFKYYVSLYRYRNSLASSFSLKRQIYRLIRSVLIIREKHFIISRPTDILKHHTGLQLCEMQLYCSCSCRIFSLKLASCTAEPTEPADTPQTEVLFTINPWLLILHNMKFPNEKN